MAIELSNSLTLTVMAGLDPAISLRDALHQRLQCPPKRDCRVKPGNDAKKQTRVIAPCLCGPQSKPVVSSPKTLERACGTAGANLPVASGKQC